MCKNPSELPVSSFHHDLAKTLCASHVKHSAVECDACRESWPDLHEVAPALASQNRKSLTGHVEDGVMGDTTDQLQACVAIQDLAVRQQPGVLWSLSPGLYTCQETYKHEAVGVTLWVLCKAQCVLLSCHKEVRPMQEWLTVIQKTCMHARVMCIVRCVREQVCKQHQQPACHSVTCFP